ncbi:MAG: DUF58 domain-containing protein [Acidobacteriota bacterium]
MPTTRVFWLLGTATLLIVASVAVPSFFIVAIVVDLAILLLFAIDLVRARRLELRAARTWPPLLHQHAAATLEILLTNPGDRALSARLRDTLHPGLTELPARLETTLAARSALPWRYQIVPRRRGEHEAGPLMARVLGPWGFAWAQRELIAATPQKVFPKVRWDGRVGRLLFLAHRRALGTNPRRLRGMGSEPYALRAYLPGDPLGKIHWKATARHGKLVTREDTWERGARVLILLDCGRGMSGNDAGTGRAKVDDALAAALALTRVAVARGDRVTVVAFTDRIERVVRVTSPRHVPQAYAALYDLEARLVEPAYDLVAERAIELEPRRATVLLFTSVVDLAAAELLRSALLRLERRHRPILLNLEDPELRALAFDAPDTVAETYAQVAALDLQLANRDLSKKLRHAGIRVVTTPADRLALETLEAYLALYGARVA